MGDYKHNIYAGADYGLDSNYGSEFNNNSQGYSGKRVSFSAFGFPTDPRTANQLAAVSQKLNTGAKTIEVSGVTAAEFEAMPEQHLEEINRLRKLTKSDLTFHGPLVEASGWGEGGWSETSRMGAEKQMLSAVTRAHKLDPDGNIVITFHSTSGLPELKTRTFEKGNEKVQEIVAYDERSGQATRIKPTENNLLDKNFTPEDQIEFQNKEIWARELSQLSFHARQGEDPIKGAVKNFNELIKNEQDNQNLLKIYKDSRENTKEWQSFYSGLDKEKKAKIKDVLDNMHYGDTYVKEAYIELQNSFNKAWSAVNKSDDKNSKEDLERLKEFRSNFKKAFEENKGFEDPTKTLVLAEKIQEGLNILNSLNSPPRALKPMYEFIIDKSSDTYSKVALEAYKQFGHNKSKDTTPIISIENPPAGGGISHADEMEKLVKQAREKFVKQAVSELKMDEKEAKKQAEKLIGVTWDVGHINMLRKYGYDDKQLLEQTEKVAPYVKHIHLSDNFGYEHTELPMGMGNVPTKGHLEAIEKYNKQIGKIKQIVETGTWFKDFKTTPVMQTLRAFGSPVYAMDMAPYWNQTADSSGGYFGGYGLMLPDQHFNLYGAGFSSLPVELGGQASGRSRVSGNQLE